MPTPLLDLAIPKGTKVVQPVLVTQNGVSVPLPPGTLAQMQLRSSPESATILADLTVANGKLVVDVALAKVTIIFPSAFTATFNFERAVYDLKLIYPDTESEQIVAGKVYVFNSVTQ